MSLSDSNPNDNVQYDYNARQRRDYNVAWLNSEENQQLMEQYGIESSERRWSGDIYTWRGSRWWSRRASTSAPAAAAGLEDS